METSLANKGDKEKKITNLPNSYRADTVACLFIWLWLVPEMVAGVVQDQYLVWNNIMKA